MNASETLSPIQSRPWPWFDDTDRSTDLCSLAMIRYKVDELFACLRKSEEMERDLELKATNLGRTLTDNEKQKLSDLLMALLGEMSELELLKEVSGVGLITGFEERMQRPGYLAQTAHTELQTRREYIEEALPSKQFMYIPEAKAKHYKNGSVLGKNAREAFPVACEELIEAGNCYAAACNDACVFHAMRALESPLRSLAKAMKIKLSKHPDLATWGDFNRRIAAKVDQLTNTKHTKKRDREIKFYAEVGTQFRYLQFTYRDYVCHKRENYSEDDAHDALEHSCKLIERLATQGLKEISKP
ncbi:MAG: hypothetical protein ABSD76_06850 [Terriglobales bacterium]|jgi:hypothetical protein